MPVLGRTVDPYIMTRAVSLVPLPLFLWGMRCISSALLISNLMLRCSALRMRLSRRVCRRVTAAFSVLAPWIMISSSTYDVELSAAGWGSGVFRAAA